MLGQLGFERSRIGLSEGGASEDVMSQLTHLSWTFALVTDVCAPEN